MWSLCLAGMISLAAGQASGENDPAIRFADRIETTGETRARLERAYQRLGSPPLDDPEFVLADVQFHLQRRFTEYSGDISGRMLGALNATGAILGGSPKMIETLMAGFRKCQKADGHFGAEQDLPRGVSQERDMPICWGNGRLLLALCERYRRAPTPELLAMARRLGEYVISTRPYYGKRENFERVGGNYASGFTTCYPSMIDGLAALGQITGEQRFYDEARFIARLSLIDNEFKAHHSHGRLTAYRGMLDLDRFTGTQEFLDPVRAGCKTITDTLLMPTGGITERFDRTDPRDEGCTEADWIRVNLLLWQATGDTRCLDAAECALRNHLLAMQSPNGGFGHHVFRTLHGGDKPYLAGGVNHVGYEAYWCCSMHGTQILADVARWGVLASGSDQILVTWLADVQSTFKLNGREVRVRVKQEEPSLWTVWLRSDTPTDVTLRVRVPGWAETISINGQAHRPRAGWVDMPDMPLKGPSMPATVMLVRLPEEPRLAGAYGPKAQEGEPVRVFGGPDLFCLPDACVNGDLIPGDAVPTIMMASKAENAAEIRVLVRGAGGKEQQATLVPMSKRPFGGCRYLFHVRQVERAEFDKLAASALPPAKPGAPVEICFACDGQYEAYLDGRLVSRGQGSGECPQAEVYANRNPGVLAIKARSDAKRPGLIGTIRVNGRCYVTRPDDWVAVPCPRELPAGWLGDIQQGAANPVKLADLGGFGAAPWGHIQGEVAGTDARWIWPVASGEQTKGWWLLRHRFDASSQKKDREQ
jgi:hypothetical protein